MKKYSCKTEWLLLVVLLALLQACGGGGSSSSGNGSGSQTGSDGGSSQGSSSSTDTSSGGTSTQGSPTPTSGSAMPVPQVTGIVTPQGTVGQGRIVYANIGFVGTSVAGGVVNLYLNGDLVGSTVAEPDGQWTLDLSSQSLTPASYSVTLDSWGTTGTELPSSDPFNFVYDPSAPAAPVITGISNDSAQATDGVTSDNTLVFNGTAEAGSQIELFLNNTLAGTAVTDSLGQWSVDLSGTVLADGSYSVSADSIYLTLRSAASLLFPVVVDTVTPAAPTITGLSPDTGASATDGVTASQNLLFSGTAEAGATVRVQMSGVTIGSTTAAADGSWTFDYSAFTLAGGNYQLKAFQLDQAGNTSATSAVFAFTVDTNLPGTPVISGISNDSGITGDGITNDTTLVISGTADPGAQVEVFRDGVSIGTTAADAVGAWSLDNTATVLADGSYVLTATAMNGVGVVSASSVPFPVVINTTPPNVPVVTLASSDTGTLGDHITADNTLVFAGSADPNLTLSLFLNGVAIGSTVSDSAGNWSLDYSATTLPDGAYTVAAMATDGAGNNSGLSANYSVLIDSVAPAAPLVSRITDDLGIAGDGITLDSTLIFSGTSEANSVVALTLDGVAIGTVAADGSGNWSFDNTGSVLAAGNHLLSATATDVAGNTSVASGGFTIVIDTTQPAPPVVTGLANDSGVVGDGVTAVNGLVIQGTAEPGSSVAVSVNGTGIASVSADASGNWSYDYSATALADGSYSISAQATDAAGNVSLPSANFTVVVDTILPAAPAVTAASNDTGVLGDGITADNTLVFSGSAEAASTVTVYVNGVAAGSTTADAGGLWSLDYSATVLGDGAYSVTATAMDLAGNLSGSSLPFALSVDSVAPALPVIVAINSDTGVVGDGITSDNTLVINGTAEANASVELFVDGISLATVAADAGGNWSYDNSASILADGIYSLTAVAVDSAGNPSLVSTPFPLIVDTTLPVVPSAISISNDTGIPGDGITTDNTLVFSGSAEANATVTVLINGTTVGSATADGAGAWILDYSATPLADGVYAVTAQSQDSAGNVSALSSSFAVTVDTASPAVPFISAVSPDTGTAGDGITNSNAVQVSGVADPGVTVQVLLDGIAIGSVTADGAGNWVFDYSTTALVDGSYVLTAVAQDSAGNLSSTSAPFSLVVDSLAPAAPVISAITGDTGVLGDGITSDNTLVISGSAEANAVVSVTVDGTGVGTATANGSGAWSFDYSGTVLPDGAHSVSAVATDVAGNSSVSSSVLNLTIDTVSPALPLVLGITSDTGIPGDGITQDNTLVFNGTAEAGSTVTVYANAGLLGTTVADGSGVWTFDYTGTALADGIYAITATASDSAGNISLLSSALAVVVDALAPAAPVVTQITTDTGVAGDGITSDNTLLVSGTAEAGATVTVLLNGVPLGTATTDVGGNWSYDYSATTVADGTYTITAQAMDTSGNLSPVSTGYALTVDSGAPAAPAVNGISVDSATVGDGVTNDNSLIISGTAEANASINVLINAVSVGTATADGSGAWTFDNTGTSLADGSYSITATATDSAGNLSAASAAFNVTVDTSAPAAPAVVAITNDTGTAADGMTSDNTLVISGSSEANASVAVYRDGVQIGSAVADGSGNWSYDDSATVLADGNYSFTAQATDLAGNSSSVSSALVVTVDTAAPVAPVVASISADTGVSGDAVTSDNTLVISGTAEANATVDVLIDGVSAGTGTADGSGAWSFDYSGTALADGTYALTAIARDSAGNTSVASAPLNVTIDAGAPAAPSGFAVSTDTRTATDGITSDNTLIISGTAEANAGVQLYRDGVLLASVSADGSGNWLYDDSATPLADGTYALTATATDLAGNVSSLSSAYSLVVDTGAPAPPVVAGVSSDTGTAGDGITADNTLVITGTAEAGASVSVLLDSVAIGTVIADGTGNWSFDYSATTLVDGSYTLTATAMDAAGNVSSVSAGFGVTVDTSAPAAPVVTAFSTDSAAAGDGITSDTTLVFTGTAEVGASVAVFQNSVLLGTVTADAGGNWSYDNSANVMADGTYSITAQATDSAGNASAVSASLSVTIDATAPSVPVVQSITTDTATAGDLITSDNSLVFNGTAEANSMVTLYVDTVSVGSIQADGSGNWSYDHTAVSLADGNHTITATAADSAGNVSPISSAITVKVDTSAPAVPVVATISTDSGTAGDGITSDATLVISGSAEANASVTLYRDSVSIATVAANGSGGWSYDDTATVLADGSYSYTAQAADAAGNLSTVSAALAVVVDSTAPAAPVVTTITADSGTAADGITNDNTLIIAGTAEANAGINVYIDGVAVGSTSADGAGTWSFDNTATALVDGSYSITATAVDSAANVSVLSASLAITVDTSAPAAPTVAAITTDSGTAGDGITNDNTQVISGTSEPNASVDLYRGGVLIATVAADGSGNWSFDASATVLADGSYDYTARATDTAGNVSGLSAAFTVLVDTSIPTVPAVTGITTDTGTAADGITSDNTLIISGTGEVSSTIAVKMDGITIGTATVNGSGAWSFDDTASIVADGAHAITAVASDGAGNTSVASAALNITVDSAAPAAPSVTAITTDTGTAADGITSDNTLVFTGTAEVSSVVTVLVDGVSIGTATTDGSGNWNFDNTGNTLADGAHAVTAMAADSAGNLSPVSAAFNISIDTFVPGAPVVTGITTDSGTAGDGVTNDNTLVIAGTSEATAVVTVLVDSVSAGTTTADGSGNWSFDNTASALSDGVHAITATAADGAGNTSVASSAFNVTIDTAVPAAPVVTGITTDSGTAGDGITNDNTLLISGTSEANATVEVFIDSLSVGTAVANGAGAWSLDHTATTLSDAGYSITAVASDSAGNSSAVSSSYSVIVDTQVPNVSSLSPLSGATTVAFGDNLQMTFDAPVYAASGNIVLRKYADNSVVETIPVGDARVTGSGSAVLTINPASDLAGGTQYYVEITSGAFTDAAGNSYAGISGNATWNFTTVATALVSSTPADNATGVALNSGLALTFNEAVSAGTGYVKVYRSSDNSLYASINVATASIGGNGTSNISLTLPDVLEPNTGYYVQVDAGAFVNANSVAYAGIGDSTSLNFNTINVTIPTVTNVTSSVVDGTYRGNDTIPVQVQFSEIVNVTGTPRIYLNLDGADKYVNYSSGSGTSTLVFNYLVATGDSTSDLDYVATNSLGLNGGTIRSANSANATLTLPAPAAAGSLGANKNIVITAAALDISSFSSSDGFMVLGRANSDYFGRSVASGGDVNGDGFEDIVIGVDQSDIDTTDGGAVYVVYGKSGATRADIATASFTSSDGFMIRGAALGDHLGSSVSLSGDLNGDGYDDIVVSAPYNDAGAHDAGTIYVIWGKPGGTRADVYLSSLSSSDGFRILGYEASNYIGLSTYINPQNAQFFDAHGDFNGDGINDLLIGHHTSNTSGVDSGVAYVIFGQTGATRSDVNLSNITGQGFAITTGGTCCDLLGQSVQYIGDFNGDGYNDILVGAGYSDAVAGDAGQAYVIFGHAGPTFNTVDVSALNGTDGFTLSTTEVASWFGASVASADINGDGLTDLLVGNTASNANGRGDSGSILVLYGNKAASYSNVTFGLVPIGSGFTIYGEDISDFMAHAVKGAGDVDGDGIEDLLVSTWVDDEGGVDAGAAWIIYGKTGTSRTDIDLKTLSSNDGFKIIGDVGVDYFGWSNGIGDVNGDGFQDAIVASPLGDNVGLDFGEVNVIWGKDFRSLVSAGTTGTSAAESLVGTSGADTLVGGGGADRITGGAGDDRIEAADLTFARVDGGRGEDTLALTGSGLALDLRTVNYDVINGIELIDLGDKGNSLTLDKLHLLMLSDQVRTLYVKGGSSDWVVTDAGETWVANGTALKGGVTYDRYDLNDVSLYVQDSVSQPAAPAAPGVTTFANDTGIGGDSLTADTGLVYSGTSGAYDSVEVFVDGISAGTTTANAAGVWSYDNSATVLANGSHSVTAKATNLGGYVSAVSSALTFTVDATAPAAPSVNGITTDTGIAADGVTSDNTLIITGTAEANATVTLLIDAVSAGTVAADGSGNWSFDHTATLLADGGHAITATATDIAGNVSALSSALNIVVDTTAPAAPVISGISTDTGAADGITSDATLILSGTAEANSTVNVLRGGLSIGTTVADGAGSWSFDYTATTLADGVYAFNATATDLAANTSSASTTYNVTVDSAAPTAPTITAVSTDSNVSNDAVTSDSTLIVQGTSTANMVITLYVDSASVGTTTADGSGNWYFDYQGTSLVDGSYTLTATALDTAANTSPASAGFALTVDTSAPAAPVVAAVSTDTGTAGDGITSDNTLVISGTSEANATVSVLLNAATIGASAADGSGNWSLDYSATTVADGGYTITATAKDLAGNTSTTSAGFALTVDSGVPAAPVISAISTDSGATDGVTNDNTLVINGTGEAGLTLTLLLDGGSIGAAVVDGSGNWSLDYTATPIADGGHTLTATQADAAGNVSPVSSAFGLTVDTVNPVISTLTPTDGATGVGFNDNLVLVFDNVVNAQSGNIVIRKASDNSVFETIPVTDARVTGSGTNTITVNPSGAFVGGTDYYVQIDSTAFADVAGNNYAGISTTTGWNFTVQPTAIISSTPADGATGVALDATLTLNFNETVYTGSGNIVIHKASDNSVWDTIAVGSAQVGGSGSSTITVTQSDVLEPNTGYYVQIDAGAFVNVGSVGFTGISDTTSLNFTSANVPVPTVVNVTSSNADGTYGVGDGINVQVVFSAAVNVTLGSPQLILNMDGVDRTLTYSSGSGTNTLQFNYTVVLGDASADLDYVDANSLSLNGARIRSAGLANANLTLPTPGAAGSLGANKNIVIGAGKLDTAAMTSADGFAVKGSSAGEHLGWSVKPVGDINGDGFEDFVIGAPDNNGSAGVAYVVFGQAGSTRTSILSSAITNGSNGFKIVGQSAVDKLGGAVGGAGDINDDGYDDLYVAAPLEDDYAADGGVLYIIYGGASPTDVTAASFSSSRGFRVKTEEANARIGDSFTDFAGNGQGVDGGGDFNGDGIDDLIVGIRYSDKNGTDSGKAYVVFGRAGATRADVDLDLIDPTGPDGMLIYGASAGWELGQAVRFVGDYDADGYDDVVVSAIFSGTYASNGGQSFLIFGSPGPVFYPIDVSTLSGGSGFSLYSYDVWGIVGHAVGAGDFNGDGISDILVSSNGKSINGKSGNGAAFVIYGNNSGSYANIDVDTMLSSTGYTIYGETDSDSLGHSLDGAGDFNGDGIDDLLLGTYLNSEGGASAGAAWMVMGQTGTSRGNIDLATLTNVDGIKIVGDSAGAQMAQSTAHGDINGDGFSDLLLGAPTSSSGSASGGETLVLWGRDFSQGVLSGLTGDSGANNIVGTSGNDAIVGGGGADAISAGAGDDTIQVPDTGFFKIDGGLGTDTLQFTTTLNNLDLTSFGPESIKGIEVVDLGDQINSLTVSRASVQDMSSTSRALFVKGGSSDVVYSSTGDAWCYTGTKLIGGITYNVYLDDGAILYIQNSINSSAVGDFTSTQTYTFNTTSGGANVSGNVTNFPALIRITNTSILGAVQSGAPDIRFTDGDQVTWLPYEIERWTGSAAEVWVLVPQVDGNSSTDHIVLHYNDKVNGSISDGQNPTKLWADYSVVYHFNDASTASATDSSAYKNNATRTRSGISSSSWIAGSRDFSGGEFTASDDTSFDVNSKNYSIEFWYYEPFGLLASTRKPVASRSNGSGKYWSFSSGALLFFLSYPPQVAIADGSGGTDTIDFGPNGLALLFTFDSWNYMNLVMNYDSGLETTYLNGSAEYTDSSFRNMEDTSGIQNLVLGGSGSNMQMDEFRIYRGVLSANRIKLNYQNQRSGSNFISP